MIPIILTTIGVVADLGILFATGLWVNGYWDD
jgi:hypothetical protein